MANRKSVIEVFCVGILSNIAFHGVLHLNNAKYCQRRQMKCFVQKQIHLFFTFAQVSLYYRQHYIVVFS